jgi:hypothetical protein
MARRRSLRRVQPVAVLPPLIFRWDLDKTYLKSEFDDLRKLVRIPFEKPEQKIAAPGVTALIKALRDGATANGRESRTYFLSASPPQIGRAIRKKLELDGVQYDGIVFKDQLQRLIRGKFRHLREQVGFKVTELLKAYLSNPPGAREYLFGDDWESDPLIYSLYADVIAGRVGPGDLGEILTAIRVDQPLVREACTLAEKIEPAEAVARIFITLERRTPLEHFRSFGVRLVPTFNYFQTAVCLLDDGVLDCNGVMQVARSLIDASRYTSERLANSLSDIERRGHVREPTVRVVREHLRAAEILPIEQVPLLLGWWHWLQEQWKALLPGAAPAPEPFAPIDYRELVRQRSS